MTNHELRQKVEVPIVQKPSMRICLGCNKEFKSTGVGNRICPKCNKGKRRNNDISMPVSKMTVTHSKGDN